MAIVTLPRGPKTAQEKKIERNIGLSILAFLLLVGGVWWGVTRPAPPPKTHFESHVVQPHESLTKLVGFQAAMDVAERQNLPVKATLIASTLKPRDARKLDGGRGTDVVQIVVQIDPGDIVNWEVYDDGPRKDQIVPGSVQFIPGSALTMP